MGEILRPLHENLLTSVVMPAPMEGVFSTARLDPVPLWVRISEERKGKGDMSPSHNRDRRESPRPVASDAPSAPFDREAALARLDGDTELFALTSEAFLLDAPASLIAIQEAIEAGDCHQVQLLAHSVRGSAATLDARLLVAEALRLELLGRDGNLTGVREAVLEFERELRRVVDSLSVSLTS